MPQIQLLVDDVKDKQGISEKMSKICIKAENVEVEGNLQRRNLHVVAGGKNRHFRSSRYRGNMEGRERSMVAST